MKLFLLVLLISLPLDICICQILFQDSEGQSTFNLISDGAGAIGVNTANESVFLGYVRRMSDKKFFLGFNVLGKPKDGIANLISFTDNQFNVEGRVSLIFGLDELLTSSDPPDPDVNYDRIFLVFEYQGSKFKLINDSTSLTNQISNISLQSLALDLNYNYIIKGRLFLGAGLKFGGNSNFDELEKRVVENAFMVYDSLNSKRLVREEFSAYTGEFLRENRLLIKFDLAYLPKLFGSRVFFNSFFRYRINQKTNNYFNMAFGVYINKNASERSTILGGIFYEFVDLFNQREKEPDFFDRGRVGISIGYNFN